MPNTAYMLLYRKIDQNEEKLAVLQPPDLFYQEFKAEAEKLVAELVQI